MSTDHPIVVGTATGEGVEATAGEGRHTLPRLSVNRPVTVIMSLMAVLVVGSIAYTRIPLELLPQGLEGQWMNVSVPYRNAGPVEVEQKITRPLEEALATVPRIDRLRTSSNASNANASIRFKPHTDMKEAYAQVRDRMERLMTEIPDEVDRIWVRRHNPDDWPVMWMAAYLDGDRADRFFILDTYVRPELQRIEGVGTVDVWGGGGKVVRIELDQDKVRSHGVSVYEVSRSLSEQNFALPSGYVYEGGRKVYVRSIAKFQSLEEIGQLVVNPEADLRLTDIATVSMKPPERDWVSRIDRRESMGLGIKKSSTANMVEVSRRVRETLEELKARVDLNHIDFEIFFDQGKHITESVDNLKATGLWGGLFAALILFFFLRAVRMTLIITMAIPLSLLIAITGLYFMGWSLNLITMMGLMLSLGLVVDNAIVIVENIYRKRQEGMTAKRASVEGAGEVGLAVTMATLTTVVVFLPLMLMSDEEMFSFYMLRLGMPVIMGLLASLGIALVVIPLAALRLTADREVAESRVIARLRAQYLRGLRWVLQHRIDTTILVLVAMGTITIPMNAMKKTDQQEGNRRDLNVVFDMPAGQTLEAADRWLTSVEDTLMAHREEYNIKVLQTDFRRNYGRVQLIFNERENTEWYAVAYDNALKAVGLRDAPNLSYKEMVEDIKERLSLPAGYQLRINWRGGSDDASVALNLYGENTAVLVSLSAEVERRLKGIPDLLSVYTDMDRGGSELQVRLNREQVRYYGVDPRVISNTISYSLRGRELPKFETDEGRQISVFMQLEDVDRQSIHQLRNLTFPTRSGLEVPLESLASLYVTRTLGGIRREDRQTVMTVTASTTKDDAQALFEQIDEAMAGFEMPRGYRWDKGARYVRIQESDASQQLALLLSVIFVFLLMGVLFESFVLPLSVIAAIPFSFLGVYWTLYLTGTPFDVLSGIGTIILVGVVVNNAIVLIDLTNRLRAQGMDRFEALVEAGKHRFRPILMTTFTTACGLIPMAVGNAKMIGMPYAPLGRTMMGGLLASTVLTLVIVPLCYTFFDDLRLLLHRVAQSGLNQQGGPAKKID
jgi:HAE1 family hydrophobic/amphiphilic exporter-1